MQYWNGESVYDYHRCQLQLHIWDIYGGSNSRLFLYMLLILIHACFLTHVMSFGGKGNSKPISIKNCILLVRECHETLLSSDKLFEILFNIDCLISAHLGQTIMKWKRSSTTPSSHNWHFLSLRFKWDCLQTAREWEPHSSLTITVHDVLRWGKPFESIHQHTGLYSVCTVLYKESLENRAREKRQREKLKLVEYWFTIRFHVIFGGIIPDSIKFKTVSNKLKRSKDKIIWYVGPEFPLPSPRYNKNKNLRINTILYMEFTSNRKNAYSKNHFYNINMAIY